MNSENIDFENYSKENAYRVGYIDGLFMAMKKVVEKDGRVERR